MRISARQEQAIQAYVKREQAKVDVRPDGTRQYRHATPPDGATGDGRLQRICTQRLAPVENETGAERAKEMVRDSCTMS